MIQEDISKRTVKKATSKHINNDLNQFISTISIKTKRTRSRPLLRPDHRPSSNRLKFGQEMPLGPLCTGKIVRQHLVNKCCLNLKSKIWTFFRQLGFLSKSAQCIRFSWIHFFHMVNFRFQAPNYLENDSNPVRRCLWVPHAQGK